MQPVYSVTFRARKRYLREKKTTKEEHYTPRVGQLVRFKGKACPASNGAIVSIQRKSSTGRFRTVRRTTLKDAATCSKYGRSLRIRKDGTYRVTTDDAARARGYSIARFLNAH